MKTDISLIIRQILKSNSISQKILAEKINMSPEALGKALKRGDFKVSVLEKIAEVLEVPIGTFFGMEKKQDSDLDCECREQVLVSIELLKILQGVKEGKTDISDIEIKKIRQMNVLLQAIKLHYGMKQQFPDYEYKGNFVEAGKKLVSTIINDKSSK